MLYSQISEAALKRITGKFGFNIGIINAEVNVQEQKDLNRFNKLKIVMKYLEEMEQIGSIDNPNTYFRGNLPMVWGDLDVEGNHFAYFGGSNERTIVGLGGSIKHIIGLENINWNKSLPLWYYDSSVSYVLVNALKDEVIRRRNESYLANSIFRVDKRLKISLNEKLPQKQKMEFCAKRLFHGSISSRDMNPGDLRYQVLLGSPMYVALAE